MKLVLSHHLPTTDLLHTTSENFAQEVAEGTKGQVAVDIQPTSQLVNQRTAAEALARARPTPRRSRFARSAPHGRPA